MKKSEIEKKNPALEEIVYRLKAYRQSEEYDPFNVPEECVVCGAENRLLTGGVCTDCILDTVDYDTVYEWLQTYMNVENHEEVTHIEGLMLGKWLGLPNYEMPGASTRAIKEMLMMEYKRQQAEDIMCGNGFLREIKRYIAKDGIDDYSDYIVKIARKEVG